MSPLDAAGQAPVPQAEEGWVRVEGEPLHNSEACEVKAATLQIPGDVPTRVVLKRCKISGHDALQRFRREAALLRRLSHPCLLRPLCVVELPPTYGLVSELATRGSLAQVLAKRLHRHTICKGRGVWCLQGTPHDRQLFLPKHQTPLPLQIVWR